MSSGVGPPDDPRGVPSPGTPAPTVPVVGDRVDGEREPDIYIDGRVVHVAIDFFLLGTEYIYMLNRDIYCTQGAAMGSCANWPTMLPPSKSSAPVLPGPGPLPLANWRVHRVAAPAPSSSRALFWPAGRRGLGPERPPLQAPGSGPPRKVPPPGPLGGASRAPSARPSSHHRPSVPSAGPANSLAAPTGAPLSLDLPGGLARPWERAATRHRRAPRPGLMDQGPPAPRGWVGTGTLGGPTARVTLPGPPPSVPPPPLVPHATQRSHYGEPPVSQAWTVRPGSLLHKPTDPIWGVKMQNAVHVARNCCGGQFLYAAGPCTAKTPYKVGHFSEKLSDISVFRGTWTFENRQSRAGPSPTPGERALPY